MNARKASSAVYVEGLPRDATEEELFETFKKTRVGGGGGVPNWTRSGRRGPRLRCIEMREGR